MKIPNKLNKRIKTVFFTVSFLMFTANCFSQSGAAINSTGAAADASAILDANSQTQGILIPRMTTAERNAIPTPANGLMIYNIDCYNFDYFNGTSWIAVNPITASVSISANPAGTICSGTSVTFTATHLNGGTSPSYQWKLNGSNVGTNSNTYTNSSLNNGDQISCELTSNANCISGNKVVSNILTMFVSHPATIAYAGIDQILCNTTSTNLNANIPIAGTGLWTVVSGSANFSNSLSPNSTVTGLTSGTTTLRWNITNSPCTASFDDVDIKIVELPTVANAGSDITLACGVTSVILSANNPSIGTGKWEVVSGTASIANPSSPNSAISGLEPFGTTVLRWIITNAPCDSSYDDINIYTTMCFPCGNSLIFDYQNSQVTYGSVYKNGLCWLDRNLGATDAATAYNHSQSFGDLFQWGRDDDGHQLRNSLTEVGPTSSPTPGDKFITGTGNWYNGSNPSPNSLWQGVYGINNPCPSGWRLPTESEFAQELSTWTWTNRDGAYASSLKLPSAGLRTNLGSCCIDAGVWGYYWSSTISGSVSKVLYYGPSNATISTRDRIYGYSVRCLRD